LVRTVHLARAPRVIELASAGIDCRAIAIGGNGVGTSSSPGEDAVMRSPGPLARAARLRFATCKVERRRSA